MRVVRASVAAALALTLTPSPPAAAVPTAEASAALAAKPAEPRRASAAAASPEEAAAALARRTGRSVEVEALRGETRQVFAKPDGTFTLEQNVRPVRVRQGGRWVPVDTTLRVRPDGAVEPVAAAVGLAFSGGGAAPLARMARGGKELRLGWPGTLPKPVLDGDTATYPEVMPGVDLQVTADVDGFSHVLVVKSRAAARAAALTELAFPLSAKGLRLTSDAAGNLEAVDAEGGTIFTAPTPTMWDSTGGAGAAALREGRAPDSRQAAMDVELAGSRLLLRPDRAMLEDPRTRYPVYLDPYFSAARGAWTAVWSTYPNSSYLNSSDVARSGHVNSQTNRSFFQMNTGSTIHGKQIIKATLRTYETWSYSCSARQVEVWGTGAISKSTTWNNQPSWTRKLATVNVAKGWGSSCPAGGVEFDVTSWAADAAAKKWSTMTVGVRATSETDQYAWKKFKNNPTVVIEYNSLPAAPTAADAWSDPGGACASGDARPIVSTVTPKLWAKLTDADNAVKGRFEWWSAAGVKLGEQVTAVQSSGTAFYATVPQGAYADGDVVRWRVRAEDGLATSAWSPWCEAAVDATAPGREPGVSSPRYAENTWNDGVGLAGAFTFTPNGVTDVAAYVYGLDTTPGSQVAAGQDGSATIQLTPVHDGPNVLAVRSKDRAGQLGPIRTYLFNVNAGAGPAGRWPFDEGQGTVAADAADAHPATLCGGAAWTAGRSGMALRPGDGCAQTSGPVVSTSRNFAVAAWVRLTGNGATATAVTQEGSRVAGFALQYSKPDDRWAFTRTDADADGAATVRALSAAAPRLGEWTHLTGVYDTAAARLTLYVNGRLESSVAFTRPWEAAGALTVGRGRLAGAPAEPWPGDVDDVRVYGRALVAADVADIVNSAATLVGHWTLDEDAGTTAADSSGRATAATLGGGAAWTAGWLDGALALDGATGYAQTGGPAVDTRSGFTVTAWTQLDYLPSGDAAAVAQTGSRAAGFQLGYDQAQQRWMLGMASADTDAATLARTRSDAVPFPLEWTHVAGVYDALAGRLSVYVNGRLSATTVTDHVSTWNATGPVQLGRTKAAGVLTGHWPGTLDDVRVYDGVLSAEQIAQLAAQ